MDETHDVVVVGGGLAGLAAAATAAGAGSSVLVVDGSRLGGRAATDQVGRFKFNRGAHALYRTTPGRDVLDRLGVRVSGVPPVLRGAGARLGDRVELLPVNTSSLARTRLFGARDKIAVGKLLAGARRWRPERLGGLSTTQWFDDLGLEGVVRQVAETLMRLTSYVVEPDRASADLVAGQLQAATTGSVDYVHGGWATLVDGLHTAVGQRGGRVEPKSAARRIVPDGSRVKVELVDRTVLARRVVLAVGTPEAAAALLPERPAAWDDLGPPARVACLDLGMAEEPSAAPLLMGIDRPLYLQRHAPPAYLAPRGAAVEHAFLYLGPDDDPSPAEARAAMEEHCWVGGVDPAAAEEARYLHRMVACGALPLPRNGGMPGRPGIETGFDGVLVAGDWVGPVGHIGDAALASGESAGRAAVESIDREPLYQSLGKGTAA